MPAARVLRGSVIARTRPELVQATLADGSPAVDAAGRPVLTLVDGPPSEIVLRSGDDYYDTVGAGERRERSEETSSRWEPSRADLASTYYRATTLQEEDADVPLPAIGIVLHVDPRGRSSTETSVDLETDLATVPPVEPGKTDWLHAELDPAETAARRDARGDLIWLHRREQALDLADEES